MHDYSIIGSYSGYYGYYGQMPLERIPTFHYDNSIRVKETNDIKHDDETDIEFMESLYRNSNTDYYLGGWIVKAVVDILLQFTMGDLPTVQANDTKYADFCNKFLADNQSGIYGVIRELGLFGQEFCYIGWNPELLTPKIRPLSKKQVVDIRYENFNDPDDITFIRIRDQYQQAKVMGSDELGDEDVQYEKVFYDKFFWKELNPKYKDEMSDPFYKRKKQPQWIYKMKIYKRTENSKWEVFREERENPMGIIPIVEYNQNKLSFDKVGYSDLSGAIKIIQIYHQVMESTTNNSLYNSQPTLKFTGLDSDPMEFVHRMYGDYSLQSGDVLQDQGLYDVYGAYYLSGSQNVDWLTIPQTATASKEILNLLFYILVQVTGVPEWALGAGMEGTAWATVKQQSVPLEQKVRAKRMDISESLMKTFRYAYRIARWYFSNAPENVDGTEPKYPEVTSYECQVIWDDILANDIATQLQLVEFCLENHFITKETAVTILNLVNDPTGELKRAERQYKKESENSDNTGTLQKLINQKVNESTTEAERNALEQNQKPEKVAGEMDEDSMVFKVASRIFDLINAS